MFTEINNGPLISEEVDIDQPELKNSFKENGKEIIVLTGRNPKCPAGFHIINTNLNECKTDTKVIICEKNNSSNNLSNDQKNNQKNNQKNISDDQVDQKTDQKNNIITPHLDWEDVLTLGISDDDYDRLHFPFNYRDDSFTARPKNDVFGSFEIWIGVLILIIAIIFIRKNIYKSAPLPTLSNLSDLSSPT
jgi:hypothetical protein